MGKEHVREQSVNSKFITKKKWKEARASNTQNSEELKHVRNLVYLGGGN